MMSALNRGTSLYHGTQAYFCRNQQGDLLGITGHSAADVKLAWNRIIRPLILLEVPRVTVVESSSTIRSMTLGPLSHFGGDRPAFHCSFQHKIKEVQADGDHGHYYGIICCIYPSRGEAKSNLDSQLRESIENAILLQSMNSRWMSCELTDEARMVRTAESITILFEETLGNTHSVDGWQTEGRPVIPQPSATFRLQTAAGGICATWLSLQISQLRQGRRRHSRQGRRARAPMAAIVSLPGEKKISNWR
jgi:hypothetical protein